MRERDFEAAVEQALAGIPQELRARIDNLALEVVDEHPDDPDLFGLYTGIPLTERTGDYAGAMPDRIEIYRRPLVEEFGRDPELLVREIRTTVLHEVAHHFGIDDERLGELGWA